MFASRTTHTAEKKGRLWLLCLIPIHGHLMDTQKRTVYKSARGLLRASHFQTSTVKSPPGSMIHTAQTELL
ncbi:hypothetical protein D9758_010140 [Tetrapyrgos nigripes]|uniref:Uncharacterized protein n=1 Tax=Tetrapyrgos nigripes TaxID=182062 RepID=A0A8H5CT72_9AGAR|nr:hypothetical protein D9758_010140 [Tetrapyrgos nigripes]